MKTIIQVAVGAYFARLINLVHAGNAAYCAAHGITYQLALTQRLPTPCCVEKEVSVCEWMDKAALGDLLIVSDADVLFQATDDVCAALPDGADFGMVFENSPRPGVMWFRCTPAAKVFATMLRNVALHMYARGVKLVETAAYNTVIQSPRHGAKIARIDKSWHSTEAGAKMRGWHQMANDAREAAMTTAVV